MTGWRARSEPSDSSSSRARTDIRRDWRPPVQNVGIGVEKRLAERERQDEPVNRESHKPSPISGFPAFACRRAGNPTPSARAPVEARFLIPLTTPTRRAAVHAFEAGAVAHQHQLAAVAAGVALVALLAGFGVERGG